MVPLLLRLWLVIWVVLSAPLLLIVPLLLSCPVTSMVTLPALAAICPALFGTNQCNLTGVHAAQSAGVDSELRCCATGYAGCLGGNLRVVCIDSVDAGGDFELFSPDAGIDLR